MPQRHNHHFSVKVASIFFISTWITLELNGIRFSFKRIPNGTMVWHGCLYKKADWIVPSNETKCGRCVEDGIISARNAKSYYMEYRNCTKECPQPTLCTKYKFNIDKKWMSECYVCEANTYEHVAYRAIPMSELCGKDCQQCAANADLSMAVSCHKMCSGKPTFCAPPEERFFGQRLCYQSRRLHGCYFKQVFKHELKQNYSTCLDCAKKVGHRDADICSPQCGNLPTWHKHVHVGHNDTVVMTQRSIGQSPRRQRSGSSIVYMQCQLPRYGLILDYEIPSYIRNFLKGFKPNTNDVGASKEIVYVPLKLNGNAGG